MLKYNDIITKLTDEQKIRILTGVGSISGKDMKILGIPEIRVGRIKDIDRDIFPHTTSLSHSWNTELWGNVASAKLSLMAEDGIGFAIAPGAKIKLSPYRKEVSEDPYLAAMLSGSFMKAAQNAGMAVGAAGYYITESDAEWLDKEPSKRVLNEYMVRPYTQAAALGGSDIILTDVRVPNEAYADSCVYIQNAAADRVGFYVCEKANDEHTVDFIARGIVCLRASANALKQALSRYKKLKQLLEQGKDITVLQMEEELASRTAISIESIDAALDKALDFIFLCAQSPKPEALTDDRKAALAREAIRQSTVLLKNKSDVLPISKGRSVCILGGIAPSEDGSPALAEEMGRCFSSKGYKNIRVSKGYDMLDYGYEDTDALKLCKRSDITVVLLGSGMDAERRIQKTEKMTLPPNQLRLCDRLCEKGKRVIAVVFSEHAPDMEFTRQLDGVILAPTVLKDSAQVIADILCGELSPTGRLAYTLYNGTEVAFKKGLIYKDEFGMAAGPFIGYRYYDTADMNVGYPFGYGLSYTEFVYSSLSVTKDGVSFTVKNVGTRAGVEVAQVYAGHSGSAVLRPRKELCGFARVELKPGEKKRVTLKLRLPSVFDGDTYVTEKGAYMIYVGASVSDIRLKKKYSSDGVELKGDGEALHRYLQTYSNILEDNFTLEANYGSMKKTVKNILVGIGSLALALSLAIFNITTGASSVFLGVIAGTLAVVAIIFFIVDVVERSRAHAAERKKIAKANKAYFKEAEQIPVLSTDRMFKDEFDAVKEERIPEAEILVQENEFEHAGLIDDDFHIADAVNEFNKFASDRGYKLLGGVSENLFAALTSSRMMIFSGASAEEFNNFVGLLSEYFECPVCVDNASSDETQNDGGSVFFNYDQQWDHKNRNIINALQAAANVNKRVQLAAIDGISCENATDWLEPFMKYIRSPKKRNEIAVFDGYGKNYGYNIARNLWIILRVNDGQTVDMLPVALLKCAAVVKIGFIKCQEVEDRTASHGFTSYQADYMLLKESGKCEVSEDIWKKIDRLEKYASDHSDYVIGNKLWRDVEKQLGMLLSCGFEMSDATDAVVAGRLLPSITAQIRGKLEKEDETVLQAVEFIFGEDNIAYSKAYIDSLSMSAVKIEAELKDEVKAAPIEDAPSDDALNDAKKDEASEASEAIETEEPVASVEQEESSDTEITE